MYDLLIKNGVLIDGSGAPGVRADLAVQGDRIVQIAANIDAEAATVIDASGLVVTPGFVDIHSHADYTLTVSPTADSKAHQGVTTEVVGNCGISAAPLSPAMQAKGDENCLFGSFGVAWDWDTFASFLDRLRAVGTSVNVAPLVGAGTVREAVIGQGDEAPTPEQLQQMRAHVREAMQAGAFGLSSGLIYNPGMYAQTDEVTALAEEAARAGGIYTSHIRGEGHTVLEAIEEAIEVGRRAGLPVEISHLKAELRSNWWKMDKAIALIAAARAEGLDVTADMYPYNAFCTTMVSLLPGWANVGGNAEMCRRIADPAERARMREFMQADAEAGNPGYWAGTLVSHCDSKPEYEGRNLQELGDARGQAPVDAALDILLETHGEVDMVQFAMSEENVEKGLRAPWVMIGSDGEDRAAEGPMSSGKPHPRNYGTFPRVLGYYSRQKGLFPLETAVNKMTGMPAARLGIKERGLLREGWFADITVFDPEKVIDTATFQNPHQYAAGIEYVLVNGCATIWQGRHTREKPGVVLSRT